MFVKSQAIVNSLKQRAYIKVPEIFLWIANCLVALSAMLLSQGILVLHVLYFFYGVTVVSVSFLCIQLCKH